MLNLAKIKLGLHNLVDENLEFCLRKKLQIPKHLKIICGVAFGYAKRNPDVETEIHGGKRILRESVDHYIINRKKP